MTETQLQSWTGAARVVARPATPRRAEALRAIEKYEVPLAHSPGATTYTLASLTSVAQLAAIVTVGISWWKAAKALDENQFALALRCAVAGPAVAIVLVGGVWLTMQVLSALNMA
jgi:hypothetical protein